MTHSIAHRLRLIDFNVKQTLMTFQLLVKQNKIMATQMTMTMTITRKCYSHKRSEKKPKIFELSKKQIRALKV